jgi:hypothetical protein
VTDAARTKLPERTPEAKPIERHGPPCSDAVPRGCQLISVDGLLV